MEAAVGKGVTVRTLVLTDANEEYSLVFPEGTKKFDMQARQNNVVRYAFETGKVAGPTEPYGTMKAGADYYQDGLYMNLLEIFVASPTAGTVVEFVIYT